MSKLIHHPHVRNVAFAKRLQAIMAERDMTQSEVAAAIWGRARNAKGALVAKSRDRLSVWISGKNFPDRQNLAALARALGVDVGALVSEAELKAPIPGAPAYSFTQPSDDSGMVYVQIAQFVPETVAHEIHGLLLRAKQHPTFGGAPPLKPKAKAHV